MVSQSSVEAEYITLTDTVKSFTWLKKILSPFVVPQNLFNVSICDHNQGFISLCDNPVVNEISKHIFVRLKLIMENARKNIVGVFFVPTKYMTRDILTKELPKSAFQYLRSKMGCVEMVFQLVGACKTLTICNGTCDTISCQFREHYCVASIMTCKKKLKCLAN